MTADTDTKNKAEYVVATKCIKKTGNALCVYLSEECKLLGLAEGDLAEVTLKVTKKAE